MFKVLALIVTAALIALVGVAAASRRRRGERQRAAERRRRFEIPQSPVRVPLADEAQTARQRDRAELVAYLSPLSGASPDSADRPGPAGPGGALGRVRTPDGEMVLTEPPFRRRASLFSNRAGRYATAILRRLPPWVIVTPRVRLDALVTPTAPDGRDPEDWRRWRRRVRLRAVDLLLVDRRSWTPIVAVVLQRPVDARLPAGGRDRMILEVLRHVGIPAVSGTGRVNDDWPVIRPFVEEALIESPGGDDPAAPGWDASAAAALLSLDDDGDADGLSPEDPEG